MRSWVGLGALALTLLTTAPVKAAPIELEVFKALDNPTLRCPEKVVVNEQAQPYREGGYTIDGSANLTQLTDRVTLAAVDDFSVTWVGTLKPVYRQCKATARMVKNGDEAYADHSYLRLRFTGGKVYLILDMTGMRDANAFTTVILRKGVRNGNPFWSWGGTD
ncbi:hypothetical protein [Stenomitos frigidus]|uniref:Uncharacterized protein n=1 Tax=Stenomitos frigidus ULC18 TaxID=2107698 RepID=A0A2T1EGL4_9CYAN|nr:hypothetical protein [Stenomitos frigidus]PSB31902.1 hypothetical protein C7B82_06725 [Stenomitos frigidus ULC18]